MYNIRVCELACICLGVNAMEEDGTRVKEIFSCMFVIFVIQILTIHENVAIVA